MEVVHPHPSYIGCQQNLYCSCLYILLSWRIRFQLPLQNSFFRTLDGGGMHEARADNSTRGVSPWSTCICSWKREMCYGRTSFVPCGKNTWLSFLAQRVWTVWFESAEEQKDVLVWQSRNHMALSDIPYRLKFSIQLRMLLAQ